MLEYSVAKDELKAWLLSSFEDSNKVDNLTREVGDLAKFDTKNDIFIFAVDLFVFFVGLCKQQELIEEWKPRLEFVLHDSDHLKVWKYSLFPDDIDVKKTPKIMLCRRSTEDFYNEKDLGDFFFTELHPRLLELGAHRSLILENMKNFQFTYAALRTQDMIDNGLPFHRVLSMNYYPDSLT